MEQDEIYLDDCVEDLEIFTKKYARTINRDGRKITFRVTDTLEEATTVVNEMVDRVDHPRFAIKYYVVKYRGLFIITSYYGMVSVFNSDFKRVLYSKKCEDEK